MGFKSKHKYLTSCSTVVGSFCPGFVKISNKINTNTKSEVKICRHTSVHIFLDI